MYTIEAAKKTLRDGIEVYLQKDAKGRYCMREVNRLPFYLEGSPGIGKTEIVKQIADELELGYVSFSLTHHTRNSLLGLPVIKDLENGKYTEYTMSEIIAKVLEQKEKGAEEGILLLDEFSCVSDSILPAMLAFLQTKNIGMHTLPEGWVIVLCGNPPQYNRNARKFDAAILDRIRKISVEFDAEVFLNYAREKKLHPIIISFLSVNPSNVYLCENTKTDQILVTCRGWENLSHALYGMEGMEKPVDEELVGQFVKSGKIAHAFFKFYNMNRIGISEKDIKAVIRGRNIEQFVDKYKEKDISVWWNVVDVFGDYLEEKHKGAKKRNQMLHLAKPLLEQLKDAADIGDQISSRIDRTRYDCEMIPIWDIENPKYKDYSDMEDELLKEWSEVKQEFIDTNGMGAVVGESGDKVVYDLISGWYDDNQKKLKTECQNLSKEISNVFCFIKAKDELLTEKFYQIINHSELFLLAMTKTKNKDYIALCKSNYDLEA